MSWELLLRKGHLSLTMKWWCMYSIASVNYIPWTLDYKSFGWSPKWRGPPFLSLGAFLCLRLLMASSVSPRVMLSPSMGRINFCWYSCCCEWICYSIRKVRNVLMICSPFLFLNFVALVDFFSAVMLTVFHTLLDSPRVSASARVLIRQR